jgi:hypothetical protein
MQIPEPIHAIVLYIYLFLYPKFQKSEMQLQIWGIFISRNEKN